jgi:hypothetical protein
VFAAGVIWRKDMKKLIVAAAFVVAGSTAFAGGYSEPVVEAMPMEVVETESASSAGYIVPLLLLALVAAAVAAND